MDEDKLLKLTPEECFLLLTGARLFDRLVAGVTIHAEQKDELIKEIITKLSNLVPEQLESMSDELADAIVESVLGCEEMEDGDFEELELAYLDSDIDLNASLENSFFNDPQVRQLSIDGLDYEDQIAGSTREFIQNEATWSPFDGEDREIARIGALFQEEREETKADEEAAQRASNPVNEQLEKYMAEESFAYPMYPVDEKLPLLEKSLLKHLSISVNYYSVARETVDRVILDPLVILQEDGMWLVVAYCHERDDVLLFRADRMKDIQETGAKFETPQDINELRCRMLAAYK